ncbi:Iron-sulfur cluster co-chaperone protein HscB, mitochondrial [Vitis vinifera]|uniref:Iron-sulfur cluster co-chaperone protein HscB, mitochondrial n=1 Tax=Vitis vinifera TaxID=29760 RepID=A0A438HZ80_VITVI|nr:Iron-sulfur cluster co-chaperone protein HscB, mitochondrial [Vitis vinifera]
MWKKNLWTPLSPILRRRFPSFSLNSTLNIPSSTIFSSPCSSTAQYSRVFWSSSYDFLGSLKFSRKLCSAQSAEQVHVRCWNCKAAAQTTPFLACDSCRSVQPVDPSVDYFQIFGLNLLLKLYREKKYELEDNNLEGKYKDWQKKLHPDLVHSKSEEEKEYAAEQSARVIDAYQTLSKPLARAIYILKLEGVDFDEEQTISDISFLAEGCTKVIKI